MKISIYRSYRTSWCGWEWHNHAGVRWLHFWWGSPNYHRWRALSVYLHFKPRFA